MSITQFTMEEVRCFGERQTLEIRPLTFLVGENSTGKTTALACFQVLSDYFQGIPINFNQPPYTMGNFKDIVRNSRKKEKTFKLGLTLQGTDESIRCIIEFSEKKRGIEPIVVSITKQFSDGELTIRRSDYRTEPGIGKSVRVAGTKQMPHGTTWIEIPQMRLSSYDKTQNKYCVDILPSYLDRTPFPYLMDVRIEEQLKNEESISNYLIKKQESTGIILWKIGENLNAYSLSPIRTEPKRTYELIRKYFDPEGYNVPVNLMEAKATQKSKWEFLSRQLNEFGKRSGLFQNIEVKYFEGLMGNPFQLKVKVKGPNANIMDVGYGVSQILPILVYIFDPPVSRRYGSTLLLQQPEIHLHPKAQAELSSLLTTTANDPKRIFIVETHSDYMIDRARIEIRKGNINPDDVSLIYFEPVRNIVKVHNIGFDKIGNMTGVPKGYRDFFLKESKRLMGFED